MNTAFVVATLVGALLPFVFYKLVRALGVEVHEGETVLLTAHGRLVKTLEEPGFHLYVMKPFPWVDAHRVSRRLDFRDFRAVHVNDAKGTTVTVDLWLEFRVVDPQRALFAVSDWDSALRTLVSHATTSILGNREFREILCNRTELSEAVRRDITSETARWGIEVEQLLIRNIGLLPEISHQLFGAVAARIEKARADIEEVGRNSRRPRKPSTPPPSEPPSPTSRRGPRCCRPTRRFTSWRRFARIEPCAFMASRTARSVRWTRPCSNIRRRPRATNPRDSPQENRKPEGQKRFPLAFCLGSDNWLNH